MKINKTILVLSVCEKFNLATIVEMREQIAEDKQELVDARTMLTDDELYPTQFAAQIAEIDEQISYYDNNIVVLEEAINSHKIVKDLINIYLN